MAEIVQSSSRRLEILDVLLRYGWDYMRQLLTIVYGNLNSNETVDRKLSSCYPERSNGDWRFSGTTGIKLYLSIESIAYRAYIQ